MVVVILGMFGFLSFYLFSLLFTSLLSDIRCSHFTALSGNHWPIKIVGSGEAQPEGVWEHHSGASPLGEPDFCVVQEP